ncbi:MAG: amino acid permease [Proteobacteria bacterium]|nr:amino acid permease [Pseudomonadota bacterium]
MSEVPISKILGGALLVSGTCIGAGMLALPVATAAGGFYPCAMLFIFCWVMMTASAFLMLEVSLWYQGETNLITMAKSSLGSFAEIIAWITYVLFLYALMTAYTAGAASIIGKGLKTIHLDESLGVWVTVGIFATIVYCGARSVDWANRLLMLGLIAAYVALVAKVIPNVSASMLSNGSPKYLWTTGPLLVTSFGFHLLIPSLKHYLGSNVKALRMAILWGSLIPLVVYLLWEVLVLGVIPVKGQQGLVAILYAEHTTGKQAVIELTQLLSHTLQSSHVHVLAGIFGLCAMLTSFIGVALGLFDFFADGFAIKKTIKGKFVLALLTFLPPVLMAIFYPRFITALHYAGFFAAILLVIFPALMVWWGRYRLKIEAPYRVKGEKPVVLVVLFFGLAVIILEILHRMNKLPTPFMEMHLFS